MNNNLHHIINFRSLQYNTLNKSGCNKYVFLCSILEYVVIMVPSDPRGAVTMKKYNIFLDNFFGQMWSAGCGGFSILLWNLAIILFEGKRKSAVCVQITEFLQRFFEDFGGGPLILDP